MGRHTFGFEGGEQLTTVGATFFVSYLCYLHVDPMHRYWDSSETKAARRSPIANATKCHRAWLDRVGGMSDAKLARNTLRLDGAKVKAMARLILDLAEKRP